MIIAVGDIQGCCSSLQALIDETGASADTTWWFCGDIVNRGPQSLEALRFVRSLGERAVCVLGNHDLHLLAVAHGIRGAHRNDTLDAILAAPDRDELLDWVRWRPLAHFDQGHLLVHAGVLPQWSIEQTLALAAEVETQLRGPDLHGFLATMYGNEPARWRDDLRGADRARCVINALTRLRFCATDGTMEFKTKDGANDAPAGYLPWFDVPGRASAGVPIVFGHWSTLGLTSTPDLLGIDTGCVWGGQLTAVHLHADWRHRQVWQIDCPRLQVPGK